MAFLYKPAVESGRLHQGEILCGIEEPRKEFNSSDFTLVEYPRVLVVSPDCDLLGDFFARSQTIDSANEKAVQQNAAKLLEHIHCCRIYEESDIRQPSGLNSDSWRLARQNQNERYHHLPAGTVEGMEGVSTPDFYLDFLRTFSMPRDFLYSAVESGAVKKQCLIPPPMIHQLTDRLFNFQGRVCVPDPEDHRE